jgi:hypothetical protein
MKVNFFLLSMFILGLVISSGCKKAEIIPINKSSDFNPILSSLANEKGSSKKFTNQQIQQIKEFFLEADGGKGNSLRVAYKNARKEAYEAAGNTYEPAIRVAKYESILEGREEDPIKIKKELIKAKEEAKKWLWFFRPKYVEQNIVLKEQGLLAAQALQNAQEELKAARKFADIKWQAYAKAGIRWETYVNDRIKNFPYGYDVSIYEQSKRINDDSGSLDKDEYGNSVVWGQEGNVELPH